MTYGAARPPLLIAILSPSCIVWYGLRTIIERSVNIPMVVHPYPGQLSQLLHGETIPDVFIVDIEMERDAMRTIKQIREAAPSSKIVLLCGLEETERIRDAVASGVEGVILKIQPPEVLLTVIEGLYASSRSPASVKPDGLPAMPSLSFTKQVSSHIDPSRWPVALTEREHEVIRLVAQGQSNKEIAHTLSISDSTVRHHMTSIFDKIGVPSRQKLLLYAHQVRRPSP
jgi:DNA-binding NarL/FixJ family response regulator